LKILFLGYYDAGCASLATKFYLRKALEKYAEVIPYGPEGFQWGKGIDVVKLQKIYKPDAILLQGRWINFKYPRPRGRIDWQNLRKVTVPTVLLFNELNAGLGQRIAWINKNRIDLTLWGTYHIMNQLRGYMFKGHKMRWFPWWADTKIFKDYGYARENDVAILGSLPGHPLRGVMWNTIRTRTDFKFFRRERPSHDALHLNPKTAFIHGNYARAIAKSKILIFDSAPPRSITHPFKKHEIVAKASVYALKKFWEGMACKTLVMAPEPVDAKRLGFKAGHNYVEINRDNFTKKIKYYLKHPDERKKIALNGYNIVRKRHTVNRRARQLIQYIKMLRR